MLVVRRLILVPLLAALFAARLLFGRWYNHLRYHSLGMCFAGIHHFIGGRFVSFPARATPM